MSILSHDIRGPTCRGFCNLYDNHLTVRTPEVRQAMKTKFVKEEDLSYNMVFQHWLWHFIPGLFLNPLTFVMLKYLGDMGRICVDATNTITHNDDGAPNSQIPRPGTPSWLDKNPPNSIQVSIYSLLDLVIQHPG